MEELAGALAVTTRFGTFTARADDIVTMVDALPGFEQCRRYVIVSSADIEPFACLQGLDAPHPSLLVVDPRLVDPEYSLPVQAAEENRIEAQDGDVLLWLATVRLREGGASANLCAPIVINPRRMLGRQVIWADSPYSTDHVLLA